MAVSAMVPHPRLLGLLTSLTLRIDTQEKVIKGLQPELALPLAVWSISGTSQKLSEEATELLLSS